ncbi:MAG TPA: XRE family transcriptional regulator [Ruminococcaceae bacterium]|jgi:putative transcriptional regulator|nr:XRE family transcriptional regulator [Oscillospiraceae bacterium]
MIKILLSRKLGELRWTQADLARATGIRAATINALYNEVTDRVSLDHLSRICEALNCELSEIMTYVPNKVKMSKTRLGDKGKEVSKKN